MRYIVEEEGTAHPYLFWDTQGQQYLLEIDGIRYPLRSVPWGTALAIANSLQRRDNELLQVQ